MNSSTESGREPSDSLSQPAFERLLVSLRPKLHRYCARMVGSAIDAEDVVQDTLAKAIEAYPGTAAIANMEAWLFRIAHNTALDFLRRLAREQLSVVELHDALLSARHRGGLGLSGPGGN